MSSFIDRRSLIQFCALLSGSVICAGLAKVTASHIYSLAVLFFLTAVILSWIAVVRELNASAPYFPERFQRIIHWVYAQTFELFTLIGLIFWRFATLFRKDRPHLEAKTCPILLVHGYLNAGFVWDYHKKRLAKMGFGPIYTIDLGSPLLSIRTYAKKVQEKARQIAQETGRPDLTLIGHSMGGLVSYYYASRLAGAYTVPRVITIASPLQGTRVAKIGLGRCAREMQIDSELFDELKESMKCCTDVRFYNIAARTDELIVPYSSSIYMSDPERQFFIDDIGHVALLVSRRVSDRMVQWLQES